MIWTNTSIEPISNSTSKVVEHGANTVSNDVSLNSNEFQNHTIQDS